MPNVEIIIEHAERYCKRHGSRLTRKRKCILNGLLSANKALSAYELVAYCKNQFSEQFPPMSVYRILDFLEEQHLVHKLKLTNKYIACSHIACSHGHKTTQFLICTKCQRVEEIDIKESVIHALRQGIENAGFLFSNSQLEINCVCNACADS